MKANLKNYWEPTPKNMRKLGDALLAVSMSGVPAVLMDYKWVGVVLFITGIAGKFITNLFKEDKPE